ncbi:R-spondin-4 isoform X1 [Phyllopteryx taeniolatus]|uniref:R-spondin-4 isoform X1 n=1 Tax=Phyllopteryx taeniolatus TaxID=161469 RepID=UPI002AD26FAB|nr:R-spondin-4 isoform X1 [Phyllopteryx taeniolatus]
MRLPLVALAMSLLCDTIGSQGRPDAQQDRSEGCRNCEECSRDNGCVRCAERLFLFLRRDGMSQHGTCVHACPKGFFGQRAREVNRCFKCRSVNCEHCFSRDFCTQCKSGLPLYNGRCLSVCPTRTFAHNGECLDECVSTPPSGWSVWSVCLRDGAPCGFRWGRQTRTRGSAAPKEAPGPDRTGCPSQSETRRCRMKRRCPKDGRRPRARGREGPQKPLWMLATGKDGNAVGIF